MVSTSIRFGYAPPYHMLRLRQQAQTFFQDVFCGVYVPVVDSAAYRTDPFPDRQVFCTGPLSATARAKLRGREESVNSDHLFPVPYRLVLQLPPELTPGSIGNRPRQPVILHHIGWGQIFNRYQVIVPYKAGGQLVQHIVPLICNMLL